MLINQHLQPPFSWVYPDLAKYISTLEGLRRALFSMVSFVTACNLLALHRFPFELMMMGWKFLTLRSLSVLLLAPLAGFIAFDLAALYSKYLR